MNVEEIKVDPKEARELYREYKKHVHYSTPIDDEIRRAYQLIAQGKVIIRALDSVKQAGVGADGFPKLAIIRATAQACCCRLYGDGSGVMAETQRDFWRSTRAIRWNANSFPRAQTASEVREAIVPIIPIHLRPKRGLQNYHILFEAEWSRVVPVDPLLLRRIGKGDMWLVVAAWDLTEIERAALAARISA
jgi:hypothetical protein